MSERQESLGHYQMLWDCSFCGAKKLLGVTHRFCPECGAAQDPTKRYFPSDADKVKVEDHVYGGADRVCPSCQAPQSARAKHCANCGSPLEGAQEAKRVPAAAPPPARKLRWWLFMIPVAVIISLVYVFCVWTKTKEMKVVAHRWERIIEIEELKDVPKEAWRNELPAAARGVTCRRAERSKKQVQNGENCRMEQVDKGDGTFEQVQKCTPVYRSEPVYDDKCGYTVTEWAKVDSAVTSGEGLAPEPTWPVVQLGSAPQQGLGARREGKRRAVHKLVLQGKDGGPTTCDVGDAVWRKYADGQAIKLSVKGVSGSVKCDAIK